MIQRYSLQYRSGRYQPHHRERVSRQSGNHLSLTRVSAFDPSTHLIDQINLKYAHHCHCSQNRPWIRTREGNHCVRSQTQIQGHDLREERCGPRQRLYFISARWVSGCQTRPLSRMTPVPDVRTGTQSALGAQCADNICCSDQGLQCESVL